MAEPLKNSFGPDIPVKIAKMIKAVHKKFNAKKFVANALLDYETLELMQRGKVIAQALHTHLPQPYVKGIKVLIKSLPPASEVVGDWGSVNDDNGAMAVFIYMPHVFYIAMFGLDHFDASMQAQYEITQRFTAEFSIRGFIQRYPEKTLNLLNQWASDPSVHVRRLVSEGTRPRLPWAQRLPEFQKNPEPVLKLLEQLKDDPELYVRRSVANNLNDIAKDNPALVINTLRRWKKSADTEREWLIRHALRSLVKAGNKGALAILGFGKASNIAINNIVCNPKIVKFGGNLTVEFELQNNARKKQKLLIDLRVHYVKANGETKPKVFKLKTLELGAGEMVDVSKKISFKPMSTRKHYPGMHNVELLLNGDVYPLTDFKVVN